MICPKCEYVRKPSDAGVPDYECPACGVVYAKFTLMQKAKHDAEAEKILVEAGVIGKDYEEIISKTPSVENKKKINLGAWIALTVIFYFIFKPFLNNLFGVTEPPKQSAAQQQAKQIERPKQQKRELTYEEIRRRERDAQSIREAGEKLDKDIMRKEMLKLQPISTEWSNVSKLASSTPRIALSQVVQRMQDIKIRFDSIRLIGDRDKFPYCFDAQPLMSQSMAKIIDGYIYFMRGKESESIASSVLADGLNLERQAAAHIDRCVYSLNQ